MLRVSPRLLQGSLPSTLLDSIFVSHYTRSHRNLWNAASGRVLFLPVLSRPWNRRRWVSHDTQLLTSLRLAFGENRFDETRRICRDMAQSQTLHMITDRDWMFVSDMLQDYIYRFPLSRSDEYDKEIAIHCATHGFTHSLKAYMLLHFQAGDYDAVISLYDRYFVEYERVKAFISQQSQTDTSELDSTPDTRILLDDNLQIKYTPPEVSELLVLMVAAHATKNDFDGAFRRFMDSPMKVRVKTSNVTAFCNAHLTYKSDVARKVQDWIQELVLCRLISRKTSFDTFLMNLARENNTTALQKWYERVIANCDDPNRVLCIIRNDGGSSSGSKRLAVPEDAWGSFLRAFLKCSRHDLVGKLWVDIRSRGLVPNLYIRNTLLQGFSRNRFLDKAKAVWEDMLNAGIEPDDISYGAMIQAYFRSHQPAEALAMFDQFRNITKAKPKGEEALREPALLPLYNIVLHGLLTNRSSPQAQYLLETLQKDGPKPDVVTYNIFLRFYGRTGDLTAISNTLRKMKEFGVDVDVYSFTTVLSALYRSGKHDSHTRVLNIMQSIGLRPNVAMYSAIINFLVREGGQENLRTAVSLLDHMENDSDKASRPNEVTYTALLAGIHRDPSLAPDEATLYKEDIFRRMRHNGILPNRTTYHYIIKACLENPDARGIQECLRYYGEMDKRGISITNRTWYVLLSSLMEREDVDTAGKIVNDMYQKGHQPDESLRILVAKVQAAMEMRRRM